MHEIWKLLLDDDFLHAYEHGIIIQFADEILRRVFPRLFTYSADYPEKYAGFLYKRNLTSNSCPAEFFWRLSSRLEDVHVLVVLLRRRISAHLEPWQTGSGGITYGRIATHDKA
jgi:hypothetical protein